MNSSNSGTDTSPQMADSSRDKYHSSFLMFIMYFSALWYVYRCSL